CENNISFKNVKIDISENVELEDKSSENIELGKYIDRELDEQTNILNFDNYLQE
ncbi:13610_t:CDS:1, partial [Dentiscutata heterogama]